MYVVANTASRVLNIYYQWFIEGESESSCPLEVLTKPKLSSAMIVYRLSKEAISKVSSLIRCVTL
jgi:hypothetical protein